jgi:hypothetical protein
MAATSTQLPKPSTTERASGATTGLSFGLLGRLVADGYHAAIKRETQHHDASSAAGQPKTT